jgi:hypothetical protein
MGAAGAFRRVQSPTPWAYGMSNGDGEMSERLLTVGEAAEMLRTSEQRFPRRLIAERRIRLPESDATSAYPSPRFASSSLPDS